MAELSELLSTANSLRANMEEDVTAGGVYMEAYGSYVQHSLNDSINKAVDAIKERNIKDARQHLNEAKEGVGHLDSLKTGYNTVQGIYLADTFLDPDKGAENVGKALNPGNIGATLTKGTIGGFVGLPGMMANWLFRKGSKFAGKEKDVLGGVYQKVDQIGDKIGQTGLAQGIAKGAETIIGKPLEAVSNIRVGKDIYRYQAADGTVFEDKVIADLYNESIDVGYEAKEIAHYDGRIGGKMGVATGGFRQAMDSIWGMVTGDEEFWQDARDYRDSVTADRERIDRGEASVDSTKWTEEQWEQAKAESARFMQAYENMNVDAETQEQMKKQLAHGMSMRGVPISLYTDQLNEHGSLPLNGNYYDDGNNFGDIDSSAFFDNSGRPTEALLHYAYKYQRPIIMQTSEDKVKGLGAPDTQILNMQDAGDLWQGSMMFRGLSEPQVETINIKNPDEIQPQHFQTVDQIGTDEYNYFVPDEGSDFLIDKFGSINYMGTPDMDRDPTEIAPNWYETQMLGNVYRGSGNQWAYSDSMGWLYETEDPDDNWIYSGDGKDWLYTYNDADTGNNWLWSNNNQQWAYNNNKAYNDLMFQSPQQDQDVILNDLNLAEKATEKAGQKMDSVLGNITSNISDKVDSITDKVEGKIEFGELEPVASAQDKIDAKLEAMMEKFRMRFG